MKLYPDGVAEGTPEECAAYRHIDAALAARHKSAQKALPAGKTPRKVTSTRVVKKRGGRRSRSDNSELCELILGLASERDISARLVAEFFEIDMKSAANRVYRLHHQGRLQRVAPGLYRADVMAGTG